MHYRTQYKMSELERLPAYLHKRPELLAVDDQAFSVRWLHELFHAASSKQALTMSRDRTNTCSARTTASRGTSKNHLGFSLLRRSTSCIQA